MPGDAEPLRRELVMLAKRSCFLDAAAFLAGACLKQPALPFALGLLLGTAVLFASLFLLRISVLKMAEDAKRAGVTNQRRSMILYALRLLLFALAFGGAVVYRQTVSPISTVIPMCYPRLIYTADALLHRNGDAPRKKR